LNFNLFFKNEIVGFKIIATTREIEI